VSEYIRKKDGKYYAVITGRDLAGRRKIKSSVFRTKKEAENYLLTERVKRYERPYPEER